MDDPLEFLRLIGCHEPGTIAVPPPQMEGPLMARLIPDVLRPNHEGWAYHPRSDRHSVAKCLALLIDLSESCTPLRDHLLNNSVSFGINTRTHGKALDLAVGTCPHNMPGRRLDRIAEHLGLRLPATPLANLYENPIRHVRIAVEAKAVMTDHAGALPRVHDELESFRNRIQHEAITVALVMLNFAEDFRTPARGGRRPVRHNQPHDARRVLDMLASLPRRNTHPEGFDAIAVIPVLCDNNGPTSCPALDLGDLAYTHALHILAEQYTSRFTNPTTPSAMAP